MQVTLIPHALAALLGVGVARADERFRPMSRALLTLLAARGLAEGSRLFRPDKAERVAAYAAGLPVPPYAGLARASWAVEQVAVVAWYAALSWAVWQGLKTTAPREHTEEPSPPRKNAERFSYSALAFLASSALLFAVYPLVRGRLVEVAATVVFCSALAVQLAAATRYVLRWHRPNVTQGVALVLVVGSIADAAGPFVNGRPSLHWYAGEPVGVLIWLTIGASELCRIVKRRA